jgi:hypothetical protein
VTTETYTEYGVFVQHGKSELLHKTFRKVEMVGVWRRCNPDTHVTSVRTREVVMRISEWSQPIIGVQADPS